MEETNQVTLNSDDKGIQSIESEAYAHQISKDLVSEK